MTTNFLPGTLLRIGRNLQHLRRCRKLKQHNVAYALKIDESVVSRVECGTYHGLSFRLLNRFAQHYEASLDEIISATLYDV